MQHRLMNDNRNHLDSWLNIPNNTYHHILLHVFYKINKESLQKFTQKEIDKWTFYKSGVGKYANKSYITFKLIFSNK